jgi:hypothetical protein
MKEDALWHEEVLGKCNLLFELLVLVVPLVVKFNDEGRGVALDGGIEDVREGHCEHVPILRWQYIL